MGTRVLELGREPDQRNCRIAANLEREALQRGRTQSPPDATFREENVCVHRIGRDLRQAERIQRGAIDALLSKVAYF
jgi:hypothetical protein